MKEGEIQQNIGKQKDIAETLRRMAPFFQELKDCGYSWIFVFENMAFGSQTSGHMIATVGKLQKRAMLHTNAEEFLTLLALPPDRAHLAVVGDVKAVLEELAGKFGGK